MDVWFSSDWHFGHSNFLNFKKEDGSPCRDFKTVDDMDEYMIARHNEKVGPNDKFYHLGDVAFKLEVFHRIMPRLNGKKRLILGNHDKFNMAEYTKYFEKVYESWQPVRNVVFTHRPILLGDHDHHNKLQFNCHGHIHHHMIRNPRYINLCVEHHDYSPVHWDWISKEIEKRIELLPSQS